MMGWLSQTKSVQDVVEPSTKTWGNAGVVRKPYVSYRKDWSPDRVLEDALKKVTWVYRCVDAIASNAARQPLVVRKGDPWKGEPVEDHPLKRILNSRANPGEDSFAFRYRLSAQVLVSSKGAFIEIVRARNGDIAQLSLLPPDSVKPIPDPVNFVSGYEFTYMDPNGRSQEKTFAPEDVIWIRKPHLFDPYAALTPLESAGVSIETDWHARLYNRNFLLNDGRPGGMIILKGEVSEDDKYEIQSRYRGDVNLAGRISVIGADQGADFLDTAVTPRDAQYIEGRRVTKEEILMGFGVPESVLANASGRTFDNAEMERLIFWMETMIPHLELTMRPLDILEDDDDLYVSFDLSGVDVLQRLDLKRKEHHLREFASGAISVDEYRTSTGWELIADGRGNVIYRPKTLIPYLTTDGDPIPMPEWEEDENNLEGPVSEEPLPEGRPSSTDPGTSVDDSDDEPREREDDRVAPIKTELEPVTPSAGMDLAAQMKALDNLQVVSEEEKRVAESEKMVDDYSEMLDEYRNLIKSEIIRLLERQRKVLVQKAGGKKMKMFLQKRESYLSEHGPVTAESNYQTSVKTAVDSVFNLGVWNKQLEDDLTPILDEAMRTEASLAIEFLGLSIPVDSLPIESVVKEFVSKANYLNSSIRDVVEATIVAGAVAEMDMEGMAALLDDSLKSAAGGHADQLADFLALGAINAGKCLVGDLAPVVKEWKNISGHEEHSSLNDMTLENGDLFTAKGHVVGFPGDHVVVPTEWKDCKCTISLFDGVSRFM